MINKIYEHKDEHNWFIGKMSGSNHIFNFTDDEGSEKIRNINSFLECFDVDFNWEKMSGFEVVVISLTSDFTLIKFVVDMINEKQNRKIKTINHNGSIILIEKDKILGIYVPKSGVAIEDFFDNSNSIEIGDTLLIATHNEGKVKEFRKMFSKLGIKVESLNDYPELPEVEETGTTFEENARLKAETISELTGRMVLADDSGLKVDALGGLPGVWSARFSGPDATDEKNNQKLLHELAMVFELKDRSAQFHTTLVVAAPGKDSLVVSADWPGYIAFDEKGEGGFGYDPLFLIGETGRRSAELSAEEKNAVSHRGLAMQKLMEEFSTWQSTPSLQ